MGEDDRVASRKESIHVLAHLSNNWYQVPRERFGKRIEPGPTRGREIAVFLGSQVIWSTSCPGLGKEAVARSARPLIVITPASEKRQGREERSWSAGDTASCRTYLARLSTKFIIVFSSLGSDSAMYE